MVGMYMSKIAISSWRIVPCSLYNDLVTPNMFIVLKSIFSEVYFLWLKKKNQIFFLSFFFNSCLYNVLGVHKIILRLSGSLEVLKELISFVITVAI